MFKLAWSHKYRFRGKDDFLHIYYDSRSGSVMAERSNRHRKEVNCFSNEEAQSFCSKLLLLGEKLLPDKYIGLNIMLKDFSFVEVNRVGNVAVYVGFNNIISKSYLVLRVSGINIRNITVNSTGIVNDYTVKQAEGEHERFLLLNCNISVLMLMAMNSDFRNIVLSHMNYWGYVQNGKVVLDKMCVINALEGISYV